MKGSQYQADCSQGGIVRAISNGLFTPTKIYLDIPKVLANTEFASYPTIPWSIDSACTNIELNGDGNIVSFGDLSTQRGVDYTHWLDSPTAGNQIFKYNMRSSNSVGAATDYASIQAFIKNATDAAEAAALAFFVKIAGATTKVLNLDNGNVVLGNQVALATNATSGFAYIPTCAGTPTGTPDAYTGKVACVYDTTNNKFCVYNGAWKQTAALT